MDCTRYSSSTLYSSARVPRSPSASYIPAVKRWMRDALSDPEEAAASHPSFEQATEYCACIQGSITHLLHSSPFSRLYTHIHILEQTCQSHPRPSVKKPTASFKKVGPLAFTYSQSPCHRSKSCVCVFGLLTRSLIIYSEDGRQHGG